jgi:hypothetical protein
LKSGSFRRALGKLVDYSYARFVGVELTIVGWGCRG